MSPYAKTRTSSRSDQMTFRIQQQTCLRSGMFWFRPLFSCFILVCFEHSPCATPLTNATSWRQKKLYNQDAVCWVKLSRAQEQGLRFWQTKSNAIIVHNHVLADCTVRFSVKQDIEHFSKDSQHLDLRQEVTLEIRWQAQQQHPQQPQHSGSASSSIWKQMRGTPEQGESKDKGDIADTQYLETGARH